jgi:hypothetical protein
MGSGPGDHIREQDSEGLVADDFARAPDGVAEAKRRLLAGEAGRAGVAPAVGRSAMSASYSAFFPRRLSVSSSS